MRLTLDVRQHLVAVHLGHQDVEKDHVERCRVLADGPFHLLFQQRDRLAPILGERDAVTLVGQETAELLAVDDVVIDDQNTSGSLARSDGTLRVGHINPLP